MNDKIKIPLKQRFEEKVAQFPMSDCHYWIGAVSPDGYGVVTVTSGKTGRANRVAYNLYVGEIPKGMFVLHGCDNRLCVNPAHLRVGTQWDNMKDLALRFKYKVSIDQAKEIKEKLKSGARVCDLAREYKVEYYHIENIKRGHSRRYA